MPQHLTDHKSTLVQVMAWCHQATSHYLSQCWSRSLSPYDVTGPQWVKAWTTAIVSMFLRIKNHRSKYDFCLQCPIQYDSLKILWKNCCLSSKVGNSSSMDLFRLFNYQSGSILSVAEQSLKQLKQLARPRLRSEIPPAAPWLPILVIHIRSQVKTKQSQSYKFKQEWRLKRRNTLGGLEISILHK